MATGADIMEFTEVEDLEKRLAQSQVEAETNLAGWKRAKADYMNLQKEVERNRQSWSEFSSLSVVRDLIPLWISFDKLMDSLPKDADKAWVGGLKQQHKMLVDFFKKQGVSRIHTVGEMFDPEWHEAVGQEKKEGVPSQQITQEISPGFKMNNKLIIPPKVIVCQ